MDEIAPEYDVVVLGTGMTSHLEGQHNQYSVNVQLGLTECILSGYFPAD